MRVRGALITPAVNYTRVTESRRRLAAIMFTDMVGFSSLAQADEASALAVLDRHNRILRPLFARFHGREVKTVGDAFLVEFDSALEATECALEVQRALADYDASAPEAWKIRVRIGIHVGDVVQSGSDVLGDAVNIASRIEALAEPGGICVTQQVFDQVQNKLPVPMVQLPPVALKGIRNPLTLYRVVATGPVAPVVRPAPRLSSGHHLAVLPMANISPDPSDGYFADGLTEELIAVLSQVHDLSVIARTSVTPYKSTQKSITQVGAELGVDTVLEGSVRKAGNRIRITLQLIDVATQGHIWASSYNRELDDVFAVQSDVAERTATALRLELSRSEEAGVNRRPTANVAAYDHYLRGLVATSEHGAQALDDAVHSFEKATALDPTFAEAFAAWANVYVIAAGDSVPMPSVLPRARELADRALALDPHSSDAHSALGNIAFQYDNDWTRAEAEFRTAIDLNPSNLMAHRFFGLMLVALGRFPEAEEIIRRTVRLDPGGNHRSMLTWIEVDSGRFDAAIETLEQRRATGGMEVSDHIFLGFAYRVAGRLPEALVEADTPPEEGNADQRFDLALLNAVLGRPELAREIQAEVARGEFPGYVSGTYRAMLHAALGESGTALDLLEKDYRDGERVFWLYYRAIYFDGLRDDPRFVSLLREYGLPTTGVARRQSPGP
jgi:adenylate cyclase